MIGPPPLCTLCERLRAVPLSGGDLTVGCEAFPEGIPDAIFLGGFDHRRPFEGDHGIRFLAADGPEAETALSAWVAAQVEPETEPDPVVP